MSQESVLEPAARDAVDWSRQWLSETMTIKTYKGYRISVTRLGASWITNIFDSNNPGVPLSGIPAGATEQDEDAMIKAAYDLIDEREKKKQTAWPGEDVNN